MICVHTIFNQKNLKKERKKLTRDVTFKFSRTVLQQLTGSQLVDASPRAVENTPAVGEVDLNLANLSVPTASTSDGGASHTQQQVIKWQQKLLR